MVLADMVDAAQPARGNHAASAGRPARVYKPVPPKLMARMENSPSDFVVTFTEDKKGFYINGKKYGPSDPPMTSVSIGGFHHWRVVNDTHEVHPFHIHQVHFLAYAENGTRLSSPEWLDTVNVPVEGKCRSDDGLYGSHHPGSIALPLSSAEPRRQGHDGEDPLQVSLNDRSSEHV